MRFRRALWFSGGVHLVFLGLLGFVGFEPQKLPVLSKRTIRLNLTASSPRILPPAPTPTLWKTGPVKQREPIPFYAAPQFSIPLDPPGKRLKKSFKSDFSEQLRMLNNVDLPLRDLLPSPLAISDWGPEWVDEEIFVEDVTPQTTTVVKEIETIPTVPGISWPEGPERDVIHRPRLTIEEAFLQNVHEQEVRGEFLLSPAGGVVVARLLPPGSGSLQVDALLRQFISDFIFAESSDDLDEDQTGYITFRFVRKRER